MTRASSRNVGKFYQTVKLVEKNLRLLIHAEQLRTMSLQFTSMIMCGNHPVNTHAVRPDQFNLLLLGYCEVKIGSSNQKKRKKNAINWGVVIDRNLKDRLI